MPPRLFQIVAIQSRADQPAIGSLKTSKILFFILFSEKIIVTQWSLTSHKNTPKNSSIINAPLNNMCSRSTVTVWRDFCLSCLLSLHPLNGRLLGISMKGLSTPTPKLVPLRVIFNIYYYYYFIAIHVMGCLPESRKDIYADGLLLTKVEGTLFKWSWTIDTKPAEGLNGWFIEI